jgi:hypothetical protein
VAATPVAAAAIEAVNKTATFSDSIIDERPEGPADDHFKRGHPGTDWKSRLELGEAIGLG